MIFNSRHIWFKQRDKRTGSDIWLTNNSESSRRQMRKANKKLKNKRLFVRRLACCSEVQLRRKLRSKVPQLQWSGATPRPALKGAGTERPPGHQVVKHLGHFSYRMRLIFFLLYCRNKQKRELFIQALLWILCPVAKLCVQSGLLLLEMKYFICVLKEKYLPK